MQWQSRRLDTCISKGSVNDYVMQTCDAILNHCEQVIKWPSIEERRNISGRIRKAQGFVNCIGLIDGTLFPLAFCTHSEWRGLLYKKR